MELPYRFHIGTQKAGSSFLYNLLKEHPEISLSSLPKLNFYLNRYDRGFDWYVQCFRGRKNMIETSPKYFIAGEKVAAIISRHIPPERPLFLLILRNPIDYLYSHFRMHYYQGHFEKKSKKYDPSAAGSFSDFLQKHPFYLKRGLYYHILTSHWLKYYNFEQFKIVIFEQFVKEKGQTLREILKFFDIPYYETETTEIGKNRALRYSFLYGLRNKVVKNERLKEFIKGSQVLNYVYNSFLTENRRYGLDEGTREYLRNFYQDDVAALKNLLGIRIPQWKEFF